MSRKSERLHLDIAESKRNDEQMEPNEVKKQENSATVAHLALKIPTQ